MLAGLLFGVVAFIVVECNGVVGDIGDGVVVSLEVVVTKVT